LPVLTSTHNGAGEILEVGKTGEILPPGDVKEWRKYLDEWTDGERLRSAKERVAERRSEVDHCVHIDRLLFLYSLNGHRGISR
jgi:glycosyltransferase involved in cell wall biosynthesis